MVIANLLTGQLLLRRYVGSANKGFLDTEYDDRLEIWNYGLPLNGTSAKELPNLHKSMPRNRKIANVLYYHKIFESWGRSVQMIIEKCMESGHPAPFYALDPAGTSLTLPSKQLLGTSATVQENAVTAMHRITKRQQSILDLFKQHEELSNHEIRLILGNSLSERIVRDELLNLKDLGFINPLGNTRARKWSLVK